MIERVTADDILNEIILTRAAFSGCIVVTEGRTDIRVLERFSNNAQTKYLSAWGKEKTLEVIEVIAAESMPGVIAIVDADFDRHLNLIKSNNSLFYIDHHDTLVCLFASEALNKLLREFSSESKTKKFLEESNFSSVRSALIERLEGVTNARFLSKRDNLNVRFKNLQLSRYIDKIRLVVDLNGFDSYLRNDNLDNPNIEEFLQQYKTLEYESEFQETEFVNGHDLVVILGAALQRVLGSQRSELCKPENVEKFLRLAFDKVDLSKTNLFKEIKKWEKTSGYSVFHS